MCEERIDYVKNEKFSAAENLVENPATVKRALTQVSPVDNSRPTLSLSNRRSDADRHAARYDCWPFFRRSRRPERASAPVTRE